MKPFSKQSKVRLVTRKSDITANASGEALIYTATFEVFPEVVLSDVSAISVEQLEAEIQDADVDSMIERLREQRKEYQEITRKAQQDDQLIIDFKGTMDGEAFDGGTAQDHKLVLGQSSHDFGF